MSSANNCCITCPRMIHLFVPTSFQRLLVARVFTYQFPCEEAYFRLDFVSPDFLQGHFGCKYAAHPFCCPKSQSKTSESKHCIIKSHVKLTRFSLIVNSAELFVPLSFQQHWNQGSQGIPLLNITPSLMLGILFVEMYVSIIILYISKYSYQNE